MKTYTEKEVILRERIAFEKGASWRFNCAMLNSDRISTVTDTVYKVAAAEAFPLPKVSQPRIWTDPNGRQFRVVDGQVQTKSRHDVSWHCLDNGHSNGAVPAAGLSWRPERVLAIADLIKNPTELVDA